MGKVSAIYSLHPQIHLLWPVLCRWIHHLTWVLGVTFPENWSPSGTNHSVGFTLNLYVESPLRPGSDLRLGFLFKFIFHSSALPLHAFIRTSLDISWGEEVPGFWQGPGKSLSPPTPCINARAMVPPSD